MSRGQPRPRSQSTRRMLQRCQNRGKTEDAIIIDDDTENADVVLIDNPNTSRKRSLNAKTTKLNYSSGGVIYIEDEVEDPRNSSTDTTTSNQFTETFCSLSLSDDSDCDDFIMFVGNRNVFCGHSGPSRNRYGLDIYSESSMTQSTSLKSNTDECDEFECSSSDCEIMEDHLGIIRDQWEKAALRKKESGQFASTDQFTTPDSTFYPEDSSHEPILHNADVVNCFERIPSNYFDEKLAEFGSRSSNNADQIPSVNILSTDENEDFLSKAAANISVSPSFPNSHIPYEEPGNWREDNESNLEECPQTVHSMDDGLSFLNKDAQEPEASLFTHDSHGKTRFIVREEPSTRTSCDSCTCDVNQVSKDNDICLDRMQQKLDEVFHSTQEKHGLAAEQEASDFKMVKKRDFKELPPFCSRQHEEPWIKTQSSTFCGDMDAIDAVFSTTDMGLTSQKPDDMQHGYTSLIGERERHKETDEYKRAAEGEWASRLRQLQIQVVYVTCSYWLFSFY